jgi:hypothetical protein
MRFREVSRFYFGKLCDARCFHESDQAIITTQEEQVVCNLFRYCCRKHDRVSVHRFMEHSHTSTMDIIFEDKFLGDWAANTLHNENEIELWVLITRATRQVAVGESECR